MPEQTDGPLGAVVPALTEDTRPDLAEHGDDDATIASSRPAPITGAPQDPRTIGGGTSEDLRNYAGSSRRSGPSHESPSLTDVASTATQQGQQVAGEVKQQARELLDTTRDELRQQAGDQQKKLAQGLGSLSDELRSMVSSSDQKGMATDVAQQAADRIESMAEWLENREPGQVLAEVRDFASRRPGMFLAAAAGIGLLAGRLTRGITSLEPDSESAQQSTASTRASNGRRASAAGRPEVVDVREPDGSPGAFGPDPGTEGIAQEWTGTSAGTAGGERR